jgi:hypothetical protein
LQNLLYITLHRLDYGDSICDGFYEPLGDFPEIVEKGNFPTLGQLRHVQSFEQDSREVRTAPDSSSSSCNSKVGCVTCAHKRSLLLFCQMCNAAGV